MLIYRLEIISIFTESTWQCETSLELQLVAVVSSYHALLFKLLLVVQEQTVLTCTVSLPQVRKKIHLIN